MSVVLVGGMDRLRREYVNAAASQGVALKVFTGQERSLEKQLGGADALILCTGKVSHSARREVMCHACRKKIPVYTVQSPGVCAMKRCLEQCCTDCDGCCGACGCKNTGN
ncbi:MAG: DUF2325 domain-containing protein [Spirochaetaceae bacterium]|jgi:hypothetical protein|nr:DUF2325 domain-containing protein [Spirochaetaceae bacterium]